MDINPDGTDILVLVVNFCEVRKAQLAKSTLLISTLVPLGSFQIFTAYCDAKERVGCRKPGEATALSQSMVKLQYWFLRLRWTTCPRQNCSLDSCAGDGPALGQYTM